MSEVIHANQEQFNELIQGEDVVFVDFYADWCGPCKMLAPSVDKLAKEHPEVKVVKVNVDNEGMLAQTYQVQSIPTLLVFKNGQVVNKQMGFVPYNTLETMIKA